MTSTAIGALILPQDGYVPMELTISTQGGKAAALVIALSLLGASVAGGMANGAQAAEAGRRSAVTIEHVSEQGALVLADGSRLCLAGIRAPATGAHDHAPAWRSAWRDFVGDRTLFVRSAAPSHDRYGCMLSSLETADGRSVHHVLLETGWALTDPLSASAEADAIDAMLSLEDQARKAGLGIWENADARPRKADDLSAWIGTRQLVEGRVRRVSDNDRYAYLNFGADWRTDFTVRLDRKLIDSAEFDLADLEGKDLRVRGVLQESRGPLIDITHLKQIEFLP